MTQYRLWVIAIAAAIIVPLLVGFCWPSDDTSEPIWNADDRYFDVYENLAVTDVPNTTQYNGANNNMWLFDQYDALNLTYRNVSTGVTSTTQVTPYIWVENAATRSTLDNWSTPVSDVQRTAMQEYNAAITLVNDPSVGTPPVVMYMVPQSEQNYYYYQVADDSTPYDVLIVYENGRAMLMYTSGGKSVDVTSQDIYLTVENNPNTGYVGYAIAYVYYEITPKTYVDVRDGFKVDTGVYPDVRWINGYTNHGVTMLAHIDNADGLHIAFGENNHTHLYASWMATGMKVWCIDNGQPAVSYDLGDSTSYQWLLINLDTDSGSLVVYGLLGMTDFTSNYIDKLGNSARFDVTTPAFDVMKFGGDFEYYVTSTSVESGTAKAMVNGFLTPKSYYGDNDWMVILNAPSVIGPTMAFVTDGGQTHSYDVNGGYIELPIGTGGADVDVSVRELRIEHYTQDGTTYTLVNGVQMPYNIETIYFDDLWVLGLPMYHLTLEQHQEYQWAAGTFNLDYKGFCMVGILTMFVMFCLFGLMYRRTEGDTGASGMVTSIVIGIIYLILLMNYS